MPGKHILETLENLLLILKKSLIIQFPQPINDPNLTQVLKTSYSTSLFKDIYLLELSRKNPKTVLAVIYLKSLNKYQ